jgi:hypothetical protein
MAGEMACAPVPDLPIHHPAERHQWPTEQQMALELLIERASAGTFLLGRGLKSGIL